jgi:hypothetical protein
MLPSLQTQIAALNGVISEKVKSNSHHNQYQGDSDE